MSEDTIKLGWNLLCGKCKKKALKMVMPKVKRYLKDNPKCSVNRVARFYGIPKSTLHDQLNGKKMKE